MISIRSCVVYRAQDWRFWRSRHRRPSTYIIIKSACVRHHKPQYTWRKVRRIRFTVVFENTISRRYTHVRPYIIRVCACVGLHVFIYTVQCGLSIWLVGRARTNARTTLAGLAAVGRNPPCNNAAEISRCVSEINPFGRPHVNGSDYNNYARPALF